MRRWTKCWKDLDSQISKILGYKTYTPKKKVDSLLEMDAILYTNLGTDSTKTERNEVKKASRKIYNAIKKVDWQLGCSLLYAMDSTHDEKSKVHD